MKYPRYKFHNYTIEFGMKISLKNFMGRVIRMARVIRVARVD